MGCYSPCTEPGKNTTCFSKRDFQSDQKKKKKRNNSKKLGKKERENLLLAGWGLKLLWFSYGFDF